MIKYCLLKARQRLNMSFLIKLFYGNEIRREIKDGCHLVSSDAMKLHETVDKIFTDNHWTPGFWESAKKSAIKDVLQEELKSHKKELSPHLLIAAQTLIKADKISLPLTFESVNDLTPRLRCVRPYQVFSLHEVSTLLSNISTVQRSLREKGFIHVDPRGNITERRDQSIQKEKKLTEENKEYFEFLTKFISQKTQLPAEDIGKEVYRLTFGVKPDDQMSYKEILMAIKRAQPPHHLQSWRKLTGFALLFETMNSLSSQQIRAFKQISQGNPPAPIKEGTSDLYLSFLDQLGSLNEGDPDHTLYAPLVNRLTQIFHEKFGVDTQLGKILKNYTGNLSQFKVDLKALYTKPE